MVGLFILIVSIFCLHRFNSGLAYPAESEIDRINFVDSDYDFIDKQNSTIDEKALADNSELAADLFLSTMSDNGSGNFEEHSLTSSPSPIYSVNNNWVSHQSNVMHESNAVPVVNNLPKSKYSHSSFEQISAISNSAKFPTSISDFIPYKPLMIVSSSPSNVDTTSSTDAGSKRWAHTTTPTTITTSASTSSSYSISTSMTTSPPATSTTTTTTSSPLTSTFIPTTSYRPPTTKKPNVKFIFNCYNCSINF